MPVLFGFFHEFLVCLSMYYLLNSATRLSQHQSIKRIRREAFTQGIKIGMSKHTSSSCPWRLRFFCFCSCLSRSALFINCRSASALATSSALASEPSPFFFKDNFSTFGRSSSLSTWDLISGQFFSSQEFSCLRKRGQGEAKALSVSVKSHKFTPRIIMFSHLNKFQ